MSHVTAQFSRKPLMLSALTMSAVLLSACGGADSSTDIDGARTIALSIPFAAQVDGEAATCGTEFQSVGADATTITFADLRLYAHDFKLVTDEGVEIDLTLDTLSGDSPAQNDRVVQLDLRDTVGCESGADANPNFNDLAWVSGTVPEGVTVFALRFTLGVPFDLNHASQSDAAEPLRNPGRASGAGWNWQNGYKFASFDVMPVGGWTDPADAARSGSRWNAHIGSTGCPVTASELENGTEPETCTNENRPVITLALGAFELEHLESESVQVVIDYAKLVDGVSVAQDEGGAPGCMSGPADPECEGVFANLGLSWGGNTASTQSVFTLEAAPQSMLESSPQSGPSAE
jgi:uncharacterized repeat protein (TIGR04052 family)